jgi:abortive infection bacteriophage resistance protein
LTKGHTHAINDPSWHADASALSFGKESSATKRALFFMPGQPYSHPFLNYDELTRLLLSRGMRGDYNTIKECLENVGYQRLQAYWGTNTQGQIRADFDSIWTQYCFDRQIRLLLIDAIERIEISVRNKLVHYYCESYGAFGYLDINNFHKVQLSQWQKWQDKINDAAKKSSMLLVRDFFARYSDQHLPLWIACELMDFGATVFFFSSVGAQIQKKVSRSLGLPSPTILVSWLRALNDVRNACAHHNRVWNRGWVKQPAIPAKDAAWYSTLNPNTLAWESSNSRTVAFNMAKTGGILTICHYLLKQVASKSQWKTRFFGIIQEPRFINIPHAWMGFPDNWQNHPLWK